MLHSTSGSTAFLALNGEIPPGDFLASILDPAALVIAADGAALLLHERSIHPSIIIGDLDSLSGRNEEFQREGSQIISMPDQDSNDLEKGLVWLIQMGIDAVTIVGSGGGMIDHTLNNFSILARYAGRISVTLRDLLSTAYLVTDHLRIPVHPGDRISLIPLPSATLTTSGLHWELSDETLAFGTREGGSNRSASEFIEIHVTDGVVALFHFQ